MQRYKSILFSAPFGQKVQAPYDALALEASRMPFLATLPMLQSLPHLLGMRASYARRGALWFDGATCGSVFAAAQETKDFLPRYKVRYKGVPPFVVCGFALTLTDQSQAFVACDIVVWKGRVLQGVPFLMRDQLLKHTLAQLVDNQPPRFLQEERLRLPDFQPLPSGLTQRQALLDVHCDLYITDPANRDFRVWCLYWTDEEGGVE